MKKNALPWMEFIDKTIRNRNQYNEIKANPDSRAVSTLFAKKTLGNLLLFAGMITLSILSLVGAIKFINGLGIILALFLIVFAIYFAIYSIFFMILMLNCSIKQLILNKKPLGWISLILSILVICAGVFALLYTIGTIL